MVPPKVFHSIFDFFTKRREQKALRDEDDKALFVQRYKAFREVLNANNEVLLAMADMQEKASGAFIFDKAYVQSSYDTVSNGIRSIIDSLDELADGKYKHLIVPYQKTDAAIRGHLAARVTIPKTDYVISLKDLKKEDMAAAGGKFSHLGELRNVLGLPVPHGFVITTYAYQSFVQHNQIQDLLKEKTEKLDIRNYEALQAASKEMQELVTESEIPEELETALLSAYSALCEEAMRDDLMVAVRSSALHEDIMASFAGQYATFLNVPIHDLLLQYKNVLASQFTPRALLYYREKGFAIEEMAMAVGILAMVEAKASGILYSHDPTSPKEDVILINAIWGLGAYAVGGRVPTNNYRVSGESGRNLSDEALSCQDMMLVMDTESGTKEVPVPDEFHSKPCLTDEQVSELASIARRVEAHFGQPQDLEWAITQDEQFYFLQSRPLRLVPKGALAGERRPRVANEHRILLDKGTIACRGVGAGPVHVVQKEEDFINFSEGDVLVTRHTPPELAPLLQQASAVVSDIGNILGHLATVAREYKVPAIFGTERATQVLSNGMRVTVDAMYANVYEGIVEEVVKEKEAEDSLEAPATLKQLREILQMITPLNLTDPRSPNFSPKGCKTLHDITRFAHEVAMRAIFELSKESHFAERSAKQLVSGVPLKWWVIDLEDGIAEGVKGKKVRPEEITSIPMHALWEGMIAMPWKGPPPVDTKGFMSVMFSATTDPSIDPSVGRRFADKNYIMVAKHFCNVSTRLGFHFSTIEAYVGDKENQNYISLVYTGGGADPGRKSRRAILISRLLEKFDFRVEKREDTIFARIEGYKQGFLEERLKVLGHIIVHTRQMDMVMYNDAMVDWYYKDFLKDMESLVVIPH
ncbi:MAG: PEP/pyruvate-binding domain-containing protein [Desulfobacteraceae bacterium]|jgi:pyruvate,water dikinase